jgi:CelD/BcsL family acetyltransferase involved in cellulose biosynthesis
MNVLLQYHHELTGELTSELTRFWNENPHAHIFNACDWFSAAAVQNTNADKVLIIARDARQEILLYLLAEESRDRLSLLGSPFLEKASLLTAEKCPEDDLGEVLRQLLQRYSQVSFQEMPQEVLDSFLSASKGRLHFVRFSSVAPFFDLYHPMLSRKRRKDLKRLSRKLEREHGPLEIKVEKMTPRHLELMKAIEGDSGKEEKGRDMMNRPVFFSFLENIVQHYQNGQRAAVIGLMLLNDQPVAHLAGVICNRTFLGVHIASSEAFLRYSLGGVLIFNMLEPLKKWGVQTVDFGRGTNVLKQKFAGDNHTRQHNLYLFARTPKGFWHYVKARCYWGLVFVARKLRSFESKKINGLLNKYAILR